jgi:hypothetical protein
MLLVAQVISLTAQKRIENQLMSPMHINQSDHRLSTGITSGASRGGQIVFQDDFDNGFAGNNGIGPWLPWDTSADTSIWMLAAANSPNGQYAGGQNPMSTNGTTASNGWIILDADLYNTSTVSGSEMVSGWLQSPSIDCSQLSSVLVNFNQYFIYCCFSMSPLTLDVSTDNGDSWVSFPAHGEFFESANALSANPLPTEIDISCVAAGQSNVKIRFGYNIAGIPQYIQYFWGIDDVIVSGNPSENDLEVVQVVNGDVWNYWEYRLTPMEQRNLSENGGLLVGTIYRNVGSENQTNAVLEIEITDEAGSWVFFQADSLGTILSKANDDFCPSPIFDTIYVNTGWEPMETGTYNISVTISADSTDETPNNNIGLRVIEYSEYDYGHDDSAIDIQLLPQTLPSNPALFSSHGYGNFYHFPNEGSIAYGTSFLLGSMSDTLNIFYTVLYYAPEGMSSTGLSPEAVASNEVELVSSMISAGGDPLYYVPFTEPTEILAGEAYFNCLVTDPNATITLNTSADWRMTVLAQSKSDSDNSTAALMRTGGNSYAWFTSRSYTPAIRLVVGDPLSLDEINDVQLGSFNIFPNPASTHSMIKFNMKTNGAIAYEIRDVQGKLVTYSNLGIKAEGEHVLDIPMDKLTNGHYQVSLVVDGRKMYSKAFQVYK